MCAFHNENSGQAVENFLMNPVLVVEKVPITCQSQGPWMHVQKRGRRRYGRGGFGGKIKGRENNSRFDVLANLREDWEEGENYEEKFEGIPVSKVGGDKELTKQDSYRSFNREGKDVVGKQLGLSKANITGKEKASSAIVLKE